MQWGVNTTNRSIKSKIVFANMCILNTGWRKCLNICFEIWTMYLQFSVCQLICLSIDNFWIWILDTLLKHVFSEKYFTEKHEWVDVDDSCSVGTVGITDYAQVCSHVLKRYSMTPLYEEGNLDLPVSICLKIFNFVTKVEK